MQLALRRERQNGLPPRAADGGRPSRSPPSWHPRPAPTPLPSVSPWPGACALDRALDSKAGRGRQADGSHHQLQGHPPQWRHARRVAHEPARPVVRRRRRPGDRPGHAGLMDDMHESTQVHACLRPGLHAGLFHLPVQAWPAPHPARAGAPGALNALAYPWQGCCHPLSRRSRNARHPG